MGRPRKRRREEDTIGIDQAVENDFIGFERDVMEEDGIDHTALVTSEALLDPGLLDFTVAQTPVHNAPETDFNFDFSQDFGVDPLLSIPSLSHTQDSRQQPPSPRTTNYHTLPIDPEASTNNLFPAPRQMSCRCLPKLYMTLSAFQTSAPPAFPFSVSALKKASKLASDVVRCQVCAREYNSALQNSMLLGTLINLILAEYRRLLRHIDEKAASSDRIPLRMGENSPENAHLHTGTIDCPMGIDLELSGKEWGQIARKVVFTEIYGTSGNGGLSQTVQEMRDRQVLWHSRNHSKEHDPHHGNTRPGAAACGEGSTCTQILFIDKLDLLLSDLNLNLNLNSNDSTS